jgi:predicted PurR-regulated permease PerM
MDEAPPQAPPESRARVPTPRREVTVSWQTLIVLAIAIGLGWAFLVARQAVLLIFISLFLAIVFQSPANALERRWHVRRGTAAMILVFGTVAIISVLATLLVTPFVGAVQDLIRDLPNLVRDFRDSDLFRRIDERTDGDLGAELQKRAEDLAGSAPGELDRVFAIGGKVFSLGLSSITVVFMTLFLVIDLPKLSAAIRSVMFPDTADRIERLEHGITRTVGRYALGAVLIATIAGTVQGTAAYLLGAPFALALGIIAGLLGLIPQVGATLAAIILSLVTLTVGWPQAVAMLAVCLVYQQVENYVLQPTIQGRAADVSGFVVIASVVLGASLLGVVGALIAVPVAASIQIVVRELTADRRAAVARARASASVGGPAPPATAGPAS